MLFVLTLVRLEVELAEGVAVKAMGDIVSCAYLVSTSVFCRLDTIIVFSRLYSCLFCFVTIMTASFDRIWRNVSGMTCIESTGTFLFIWTIRFCELRRFYKTTRKPHWLAIEICTMLRIEKHSYCCFLSSIGRFESCWMNSPAKPRTCIYWPSVLLILWAKMVKQLSESWMQPCTSCKLFKNKSWKTARSCSAAFKGDAKLLIYIWEIW